ncbi:hypothetical protein SERLA73DRAFT_174775, partial [Serpula lacrymans var. lacrymans S7.3]
MLGLRWRRLRWMTRISLRWWWSVGRRGVWLVMGHIVWRHVVRRRHIVWDLILWRDDIGMGVWRKIMRRTGCGGACHSSCRARRLRGICGLCARCFLGGIDRGRLDRLDNLSFPPAPNSCYRWCGRRAASIRWGCRRVAGRDIGYRLFRVIQPISG